MHEDIDRERVLPLLVHVTLLTGVSNSISVSLYSVQQIRQMTSHRPSLSPLAYSFQHINTDMHIFRRTCTPEHLPPSHRY